MNYIEFFASFFGLLCLFLVIRRNIWCWPVGIINITLFFILFYQVQLYAELVTCVIFFILSVYGWWNWLYGGKNKTILPISRMPFITFIFIFIFGSIWWLLQGYFFHNYTLAYLPYWTSLTTVLSLFAQWALSKKYIENWFFWMIVNILKIGIYWNQDLHITFILHIIFLTFSIWGFITWFKFKEKEQ